MDTVHKSYISEVYGNNEIQQSLKLYIFTRLQYSQSKKAVLQTIQTKQTYN